MELFDTRYCNHQKNINKLIQRLRKIMECISTAPPHAALLAKATPGIHEPKKLVAGGWGGENWGGTPLKTPCLDALSQALVLAVPETGHRVWVQTRLASAFPCSGRDLHFTGRFHGADHMVFALQISLRYTLSVQHPGSWAAWAFAPPPSHHPGTCSSSKLGRSWAATPGVAPQRLTCRDVPPK